MTIGDSLNSCFPRKIFYLRQFQGNQCRKKKCNTPSTPRMVNELVLITGRILIEKGKS